MKTINEAMKNLQKSKVLKESQETLQNVNLNENNNNYIKEIGFDPYKVNYSKNPQAQEIIEKFKAQNKLDKLFDYICAGIIKPFNSEEKYLEYVADTNISDYEMYNGKLEEDIKEPEEDTNTKIVYTGLTDAKSEDVLNAVIGQLSDGIWENSPRMNKYWRFANIVKKGSELCIVINNIKSYENGFRDMNEQQIAKWFAQKVKQIVKEEELTWDRGNTQTSTYLDYNSGVTVKDAYRVYDQLLGRKQRITEGKEYDYMLLDRLAQDCKYFLGNGNRDEKHLWAKDIDGQIAKMKELWNNLDEKPEWLSMEDIENFEKQMKNESKLQEPKINENFYNLYNSFNSLYGISKYNPKELKNFINDLQKQNRISDKDANVMLNFADKYQQLINSTGYESKLQEKLNNQELITYSKAFLDAETEENLNRLAKEIYTYSEPTYTRIIEIINGEGSVQYKAQHISDILYQLNESKQLTEDSNNNNKQQVILDNVKAELKIRGFDIDMIRESCSHLYLGEEMRTIIHSILQVADLTIAEYEKDFDFYLTSDLKLSIILLDEEGNPIKEAVQTAPVRQITSAEKKILNAARVSKDCSLDNLSIETLPNGDTHIMTKDGNDIVTIGPLSDEEKEDLRLNGYYKFKNESLENNVNYKITSYYDNTYNGIEDSFETKDIHEVEDYIWNKVQNGNYVKLINTVTGNIKKYTPDKFNEYSNNINDLEESNKLTESIEQMNSTEIAEYIFNNFEEIIGIPKDEMFNKNDDANEIVNSEKLDIVAKKIQPELDNVFDSDEDKDYVLYTLEGLLSDYAIDNKLAPSKLSESLTKNLPELKMTPRTNSMKNYKKIDIYVDGKYFCSTNAHKTVKDAIAKISSDYPELKGRTIKGNFVK